MSEACVCFGVVVDRKDLPWKDEIHTSWWLKHHGICRDKVETEEQYAKRRIDFLKFKPFPIDFVCVPVHSLNDPKKVILAVPGSVTKSKGLKPVSFLEHIDHRKYTPFRDFIKRFKLDTMGPAWTFLVTE